MARMASLLGALGGVMSSFGLLCFLLAFFQPLMPMHWVFWNLAIGLSLLIVAAVLGFDGLRERLRSGSGRRAGVRATNALLVLTLGLAILGVLAFLSTSYSMRFDWTEERVNTLSELSLVLLSRLEEDVVLTAFFRAQDSTVVRDLLVRYDEASPRVSLAFVDPSQRPDLIEAHAIEPGDLSGRLLLMTMGKESITVRNVREQEVTNAFRKLTQERERTVYFVTGHGEREITAAAGTDREERSAVSEAAEARGSAGFSRAVTALRNETYRVKSLLLPTAEAIPADAEAVVIAGPTRPFFGRERELLDRYLTGGGALMVLVDPRAKTNLYGDLQRWGVELGDDVIVDLVESLSGQPTAPLAGRYAEAHPIARSLGRTVFPLARSATLTAGDDESGMVELVLSSPSAWAERDLDEWLSDGRAMQGQDDLGGPVAVAVAGRPRLGAATAPEGAATPESKLVVFGDSSFATNEFLDVFANRDLFLNAMRWLVGDEERIAISPNQARSSTLSITSRELQAIQYLSLFVLPEGIAIIGVFVGWWRR